MTDASTARRSHSIVSALRGSVYRWYALLGSIGAWIIHLIVLASLVRLSCNAHRYENLMHITTAITLLMAAAAMALSWRVLKLGVPDDSIDTTDSIETDSRNRFLGALGLIIGAFNVALISLEEVYVVLLHAKRCG